jgi:ADP-ribosyl-[dinitrogen reductase] hydrolase
MLPVGDRAAKGRWTRLRAVRPYAGSRSTCHTGDTARREDPGVDDEVDEPMRGIEQVSRVAGAAWGHLVGDAVGVPYEFRSAASIDDVELGARGTHGQPPGTWSDDGALMLALLDSLLEAGFDPEDQGRRALAWQHEGAYTPDGDGMFDIGVATRAALRALADGSPAIDAGPAHERSSGNGSLMRVLPIALLGRDDHDEDLVERAHLASRVTHGHPRCQVACAAYVLVVARLLRGSRRSPALRDTLRVLRRIYARGAEHASHRAALDELETFEGASGSGFVVDSFWSAWDAFNRADTYADAIRAAVRLGNDTDTTAAIAGGLAGAYWGWDSIPIDWRRGMRGREVATPLIDRLVARYGAKTSTASPLRYDEIPLDGTTLAGTGGRLGITFLPGKKTDGWTGLHWRDPDLDLEALVGHGVDTLFLLVEDVELERCRVTELPELLRERAPGIELIRHPIRDPRVPRDPASFKVDVRDLCGRIAAGRTIAIACRGGMDRAGMAASCLLTEAGLDARPAIARVQAHRDGAITLAEQQALVRSWHTIA